MASKVKAGGKRIGKRDGTPDMKKSPKAELSELQEYEIIKRHVNGDTDEELASEYKVSIERIRKLIKSPIYKMVLKDRAKALSKVTKRAFGRHDQDYIDMVSMYFKRAMDPKVINKSGLGTLFSVLETVARRFENIERAELETKKAKMELIRLKMEIKQAKQYMEADIIEAEAEPQEPSIIGNFITTLRQRATPNLDKRREEIDKTIAIEEQLTEQDRTPSVSPIATSQIETSQIATGGQPAEDGTANKK